MNVVVRAAGGRKGGLVVVCSPSDVQDKTVVHHPHFGGGRVLGLPALNARGFEHVHQSSPFGVVKHPVFDDLGGRLPLHMFFQRHLGRVEVRFARGKGEHRGRPNDNRPSGSTRAEVLRRKGKVRHQRTRIVVVSPEQGHPGLVPTVNDPPAVFPYVKMSSTVGNCLAMLAILRPAKSATSASNRLARA